ncbi:flagellar basal-body rod protein FlgC [Desulfurispirillum indicum S5]|uniref:Flagellar basal-body rod protein FlgC n=1 Tax=Desulfurispirillum indicum (strain ATCC BAA-1389 / DSM 22839 / S5) TaxID=653733 RepID=E6W3P4_DESIS|nr:flagellar basal body rod protein FlgC [Desulfurispirillum indicum]ADU66925.1 flagellar basal-body rod protein FlgC [Desulfurispirillum indicum S5]
MSFFDGLKISSSALFAQRQRMNVISSNLANAHTTRAEDGTYYKRKDLVFKPQTIHDDVRGKIFPASFEEAWKKKIEGVRVEAIIEDDEPPILKYDPSHPDADEEGYVAYPNINVVEEMTDMITASRSYEANITMIETIKKMANEALGLGRV